MPGGINISTPLAYNLMGRCLAGEAVRTITENDNVVMPTSHYASRSGLRACIIIPIEDVCRDYISHLNPTKRTDEVINHRWGA